MRILLIVLWCLSLVLPIQARQVIDLPGFCLATQATVPNSQTQWTYRPYSTLFEKSHRFAAYRTDSSVLCPYFLTPSTYFVGEESYIQTVDVPADWNHQCVTLELERVHIVSRVWVNGVEAASLYPTPQVGLGCRSLGAPHRYDLTGLLRPGSTDTLRIQVDNRLTQVPVGCNSYSVSDDDQGNWNGFIGRARLTAQPPVHLEYVATQVFPHIDQETATVQLQLRKLPEASKKKRAEKFIVRLWTEVGEVEQPVELNSDSLSVEVQLSGLTQRWDEYNPNLYHLKVQLLDKRRRVLDEQQLRFGMREVSTEPHFVRINGRRCYLRGNVDAAQFPLTGYPPMDEAYWISYFEKLRPWGINLVRFHSWCPPEAAFEAADSLGFYLQVECSSWPNHDVMLQPGNPTEQYLRQEADQILQAYGNHPSLVLLSLGNEPKGKEWVDFANDWMSEVRARDPRHLYYAFATGGSWPWASNNDLHVRAGYRGVDWDRKSPESRTDFNAAIDTLPKPFVVHELGQWSTYPALRDIPKFTGFMKPAHSMICRDQLEAAGMSQLADSFLLASGRLQVLCYKFEMERIRRTRNMAGYNLQALSDYTGQGTSNEGILNVFYEPKGYVSPEEWAQFGGEVVPLMRTARFVYSARDTLKFQLELSNLGAGELKQQACCWELSDRSGKVLLHQDYGTRDFPWGGGIALGEERVALSSLGLTDATQLVLQLRVGDYKNQWNLWVYPEEVDLEPGDIYVTTVPDNRAKAILEKGGKVLMVGFDQINLGRNIKQMMLPEFWNHLWSSKYSSHTHGLLIQNHHPIFRHFPTDYHSDLQWWELVNRTYPIWFEDLPVRPLVQSIDNAYSNRRLGALVELRVGSGKLVLTNLNLLKMQERRPVARQLYSSILQYMKTDEFQPTDTATFEQVFNLYAKFKELQ